MSGRRRLVAALAVSLAVQTLTAMGLAVPSVLAPVAASDFDVAPTALGRWVGFAYMIAMFAGLAGGTLVGRYGPSRVHQAAVLGVALGLATGAGAQLALLLLCGLFLGAAHGLVNPASSAILAAASPPRIRSMVFSIKQTGVPLGGAIAGLLVPALLLWMSWQAAVLALAIGAAVLLVLVVRHDPADDAARRLERLRLRSFAAPVAEVWANRPILELAAVSGVYSAIQISFLTYLVSYLKLELGYSLVAAGVVFAVAQISGAAGRVLWGVVADHFLEPRSVLASLGLVMVVCGGALASLNPAWPQAAVVGVCVLYGATAVGWNGVFLAEVARLAPEGRVAYLTGGTQFFTFAGVLIGPPLFGAIASVTGSYGAGFVVTAALPLLVVVPMLARRGP
ncbi:MAG TPA: MFS transporter [Burkholderiales bacterium]|nr:MFS transporter [Burkholderiales bacterium]